MYIKNVRIKNFRNFKDLTIPLNRFTILIGENDIGKSNLIKAIKLVLNNNTFEYSSKTYGKNIYAITYTNYAKRNIEEKVLEQKGYIPDNIKISTIHTFLLNEIIYPYSSYILNKKINKASSVFLPDDKKRRNSKMSQLEKQGIVHNEKVFNIAKQIIVGNKQQTKKEKYRRSLIINHFIASIDSIYIGEAQDLDNDIVEIIKLIALNNIYIYMVGDPKQAPRNTKVFLDFVDEVKVKK